jgi:HAD superfamily hydrolase (TIGR01509 family)
MLHSRSWPLREVSVMITTVLFDLGNVLVTFDPERIVVNFSRAVGMTPEEIHDIPVGHLKTEFELGTRSPESFRDAVSMALNCELDEDEFVRLWSDIFEANEPMFKLYRRVRRSHRTYVLSNTDPFHMRWILEQWPELGECDGLALSYELGCLKPDPEFFDAIIDRFELTPSECLYIDDLIENVRAGHEAGFHAIHYKNAKQVLGQVEPMLAARA